MRILLLASTALGLALGGEALALDRTADAALADANYWTGFYLGGEFGVAVADSDFSVDGSSGSKFFSEHLDDPAIIGGVYAGYTRQFGRLLLGVEGDFNGLSLDGGNDDVFFDGKTEFDYSAHWLSTARVRAGVTYSELALYATGGVAFGQIESHYSDTFAGDETEGSTSDVEIGWTAGAGLAWALDRHWSAKAEYLYVDLGDAGFTSKGDFTNKVSFENKFNIGRLGLAYKF